jgi:outer membrane protein assembly factor BamB
LRSLSTNEFGKETMSMVRGRNDKAVFWLGGIAWVWLALAQASAADAQVVLAAPVAVAETANPNDPKRPFNLPAQKTEVSEALAEFRRLSGRDAWERAFKELEKVQQAPPSALAPADDGLWLPTRRLVRRALADLPPAGKQAYRLFHDADAKLLLDAAQGKDEVEKLNKIFNDYFITSAGDAAADRLGDIYFEQGEMDKAAECWQSIVDFRPETSIPRVRLLTKTAIALARAGRWPEFTDMRRQVRDRHAGEKVVLGGKEIPASQRLDELAALESQEPRVAAENESLAADSDLALPKANDPRWQFRLFNAQQAAMLSQAGQNWGWGAQFPVREMVPAAIMDDQRVYLNIMGYLLAVDLKTGKLLWRTAKLHELPQKVQQNQYHFPEQYSLAIYGDTLWGVTRDIGQIGQHGQQFRLARWSAAYGKAGWSSQSVGDLQNWNMMGRPLPVGDRVYVAAGKQGQGSELHLLAVAADNGKLLWSTHLGTHQADQSQMFYRRTSQPSLVLHAGRVLVDTHAGALVAVDVRGGAIDWGMIYESQMPDTNYWYNQAHTLTTVGAPQFADNVLYFKGMRSPRLYAVDLSGPKVLWKRPVSDSAMFIGADRDKLYLGGEEVLAIDLKSQKLKWATRLPIATGWIKPLLTKQHVYQFTQRGVFELDKATGDTVRLFRGADLDSLGGVLLITPESLITVSNLAVTAYPLQSNAEEGAGQGAEVQRDIGAKGS